jgi:hypothetical protein
MLVRIYVMNLGIQNFPGDFDRPPQILTNVQCHIESKVDAWYCTGRMMDGDYE